MPIDTSMYANLRPAQIDSPLNALAQVMQVQHAMSQNRLADLNYQQQQQKFDMLKGYLGGGQEQGNALMAPSGAQPGLAKLKQLEGLALLGIPGAKEAFDIYKYQTDGVKRDAGAYYKDPVTGETKFYANPKDGVTIDPTTNTVSTLAGAPQALGQVAGAVKSAETAGVNSQTLAPLDRIDPTTGRPYAATTGQLVQAVGGGTSAVGGVQQNSQSSPSTASGFPKISPDLQAARDSEILAYAKQDILNATTPQDKAQAQAVYDRLSGSAQAQQSSYVPPTTSIDGTPASPQARQMLAQIAASRDPAKLQQLVQLVAQQPDSPQKQVAMQSVQQEAQKIQQSWQSGGPAQGGQPATQGGFAGFAGPADIEQSKADVKLKNEPRLAYANDANKNFADYEKGLNERVNTGGDLMMRIKESRDALSKFQAGGGMDTRAQVAKYAQALNLPDSVVNKIAGGDIAAAQEYQKLAAQQAMETLKQAMGTGGRITQAEFKVFQANNPNLDTDPRAIEKIYNFATKVYERDKAEQGALSQYKQVPGADMTQFPNYWANQLQSRGIVTPQEVTGVAKGTGSGAQVNSPHPADIQALINKHLKK